MHKDLGSFTGATPAVVLPGVGEILVQCTILPFSPPQYAIRVAYRNTSGERQQYYVDVVDEIANGPRTFRTRELPAGTLTEFNGSTTAQDVGISYVATIGTKVAGKKSGHLEVHALMNNANACTATVDGYVTG